MRPRDQTTAPPAGEPGRVRRDPPSVELTQVLLTYLLNSDVGPGQRIPSERQLATTLGVARSSLREGLKSLTLLGLLEVHQGSGTYLSRSSSQLLPQVIEWGMLLGDRHIEDLIEARSHLEIVVAGLAAERADATALADLDRILTEMADSGRDYARFIDKDVEFHLRLAQAGGNQLLSDMLGSIRSLLHVWGERVIPWLDETESSFAIHPPILEAVRRGDVDAARAAMSAHMQVANRNLRATMQAHPAAASPATGPKVPPVTAG